MPSPEDVRAELERILASPLLQRGGGKRRDFLRHVVEETLAGRASKLKGFTIGVDVFGRDESFDSNADPVVRLEARRLRRDLDSYYFDAGSQDPVRISIPKGGYVPQFEWHGGAPDVAAAPVAPATDAGEARPPPEAARAQPRSRRTAWIQGVAIASALAALVISLAGIFFRPGDPAVVRADAGDPGLTKVVVLPFEAIDGSEQTRSLAAGLDSQTVIDLRHFAGLRLYQPRGKAGIPAAIESLRESGEASYVVHGTVFSEGAASDISVRLFDGLTDELIWSRSYMVEHTAGAMMDLRKELSGGIATGLGQPYGPVNNDLRTKFAAADPASLESHLCVLRAFGYRRTFAFAEYLPTLDCLEQAVVRDPQYADAWAMRGWLILDGGRYGFGNEDKDAQYALARQMTAHALSLDPDNVLALKAASSVLHYIGEYEEAAKLARRAVELNPYDPDTVVQLGWRLAVRGNFAEGIPLVKRAIELSMDPPGWYYHLVAFRAYLDGDYRTTLDAANRSAIDGSDVGLAMVAMAATRLGMKDAAAQALDKLPPESLMSRDPVAALKVHGTTDEIAEAFRTGLGEARRFVDTGQR